MSPAIFPRRRLRTSPAILPRRHLRPSPAIFPRCRLRTSPAMFPRRRLQMSPAILPPCRLRRHLAKPRALARAKETVATVITKKVAIVIASVLMLVIAALMRAFAQKLAAQRQLREAAPAFTMAKIPATGFYDIILTHSRFRCHDAPAAASQSLGVHLMVIFCWNGAIHVRQRDNSCLLFRIFALLFFSAGFVVQYKKINTCIRSVSLDRELNPFSFFLTPLLSYVASSRKRRMEDRLRLRLRLRP